MITQYVPPSKWYRREVAWHFKIVFWPEWLARKLCDHSAGELWLKDSPCYVFPCPDCGKLLNLKMERT